jgi:hypothetical protein
MSRKWIGLSSAVIFSVILLSSLGFSANGEGAAQAAEPAGSDVPPVLPSTATLPPDYSVITIQTTCPKSAAKSKTAAQGDCKITVTRKDFEDLVNATNPRMVKGERRELAATYGKVLALSQEAIKRGLDRNPRVQAQIRYLRLHTLANAMAMEIYKDALASPLGDAEKYYATHGALFERFTFERIFVPRQKPTSAPQSPAELEAAAPRNSDTSEKEMQELAKQVYARAVAGEDFAKLQQEVFKTAGVTSDPSVKLEDLRRGDLSEVQNVVFDLAPGNLSPVLTDQTGFFIYKLVSRVVPPFESVREQVTVRMQNDRSAEAVSRIEKLSKAHVNAAYFDKYDPPPPNPNEPDVDSD